MPRDQSGRKTLLCRLLLRGLAQEKEAVLVTCDREFERMEQQGKVAVLWLPGGNAAYDQSRTVLWGYGHLPVSFRIQVILHSSTSRKSDHTTN